MIPLRDDIPGRASGTRRPNRRLPAILLLSLLSASWAGAETYYISPYGSDASAGLTDRTAFKTFSKAFSAMAPGDELLLLDGDYSESAGTGFIGWDNDGACESCGQPPSGQSPRKMTVVRAARPGTVVVDGGPFPGLMLGRSFRKDRYIKVQDIRFEGGGRLYNTEYCTVKNCGFHSANEGGGSVFSIGTIDGNWGNSLDLVEDCWIWGKERIIAANYRAGYNVWRRVVIRGDGCGSSACSGSGNPNVGFTVYNSSHVSVQNVLIVDRVLGGGSPYADFAQAQHSPGPNVNMGGAEAVSRNEWLGCISLKSEDGGYYFEADSAGPRSHRVQNCVAWDSGGASFNLGKEANDVLLENITVGAGKDDGLRVAPGVNKGVVRDILSYKAGRFGINSSIAPVYADVYGSEEGAYNQTNCRGGCKAVNPMTGTPPSLKHITRIEHGSALSGKGFNGSDYGANVTKCYGVDGTHYGETAYDVPTSSDLWPWPNAERIRRDFSSTAGGKRGFCAPGMTLTKYVWEYLRSPSPYADSPFAAEPAPAAALPAKPASGLAALSIVQVAALSPTRLQVRFSQPVDQTSALDSNTYAIVQVAGRSGRPKVTAVKVGDDPRTLILTTGKHGKGSYVLAAKGVNNQSILDPQTAPDLRFPYVYPPADAAAVPANPPSSDTAPGSDSLKPGVRTLSGADRKLVFGDRVEEIAIHDAAGNEVFHAVRTGPPLVWDGKGLDGTPVKPGTYLIKIKGRSGRVVYSPIAVKP